MTTGRARRATVCWTLALLPYVLLTARHWGWHPDVLLGDHAQYVSHALALLDGRPYTDIGYLYDPGVWGVGPPAYPPGFPLTLVPVIAAFGRDPAVFRLLNVCFVLLLAAAVSRAMSREIPVWQRALAVGLAAFGMESSGGLLVPLSDPGFCVWFWLFVAMVDQATAWAPSRVLLLSLVGGAAMAYRAPGVVLIPALAVFGVMTWGRWRGRPWGPLAVWGAAGAVALALGLGRNPYRDLLGVTFTVWSQRWTLAWDALRFACFEVLGYPLPGDMPNDLYHLGAMLLVAGGMGMLAWRWRRSFLGVALLAYGAMLALSPVANTRYYWPVYPVIGLAFVMGLDSVVRAVRVPRPSVATAAVVLVILAGSLARGWGQRPPHSLLGDSAGREMLAWVAGADSQAPMRLAFHNPRVVTLETGVPAMGIADRTTDGHIELLASQRITHIVLPKPPHAGCVSQQVARLGVRHPQWAVPLWENEGYLAYRLDPERIPAPGSWEMIDWATPERYCPSP
ncbi:MAG: hypothetical protein IPK85_23740 [Gemmatimonadetes bacterium]|nr:hypothetical protein [Gemmatimonadota bacterium]